jgi:hypothetical protein
MEHGTAQPRVRVYAGTLALRGVWARGSAARGGAWPLRRQRSGGGGCCGRCISSRRRRARRRLRRWPAPGRTGRGLRHRRVSSPVVRACMAARSTHAQKRARTAAPLVARQRPRTEVDAAVAVHLKVRREPRLLQLRTRTRACKVRCACVTTAHAAAHARPVHCAQTATLRAPCWPCCRRSAPACPARSGRAASAYSKSSTYVFAVNFSHAFSKRWWSSRLYAAPAPGTVPLYDTHCP